MQRRGFLKGLFGGIAAGGVIIAASPEDVAAFAAPLKVDEPMIVDAPMARPVGCGDHLYNDRGELVAIVTKLSNVFGAFGSMTITAEPIGDLAVSLSEDGRVRLLKQKRKQKRGSK